MNYENETESILFMTYYLKINKYLEDTYKELGILRKHASLIYKENKNDIQNNALKNYTDDEFDNFWDIFDCDIALNKYLNIDENINNILNLINELEKYYNKSFYKCEEKYIDNFLDLYINDNKNIYKKHSMMDTREFINELEKFKENCNNSFDYLYKLDIINYRISILMLILEHYYLIIDNAFIYKSINNTYDNLNKDNSEIEKVLSFKKDNKKNIN